MNTWPEARRTRRRSWGFWGHQATDSPETAAEGGFSLPLSPTLCKTWKIKATHRWEGDRTVDAELESVRRTSDQCLLLYILTYLELDSFTCSLKDFKWFRNLSLSFFSLSSAILPPSLESLIFLVPSFPSRVREFCNIDVYYIAPNTKLIIFSRVLHISWWNHNSRK